MRKVLFLDVDGVLLDYTNAFLNYCGWRTGYNGRTLTVGDVQDYDFRKLNEVYPRFENEVDIWDAMRQFTKSILWENLGPLCHRDSLGILKNMGYELHILTQVSAPAEIRLRRVFNLTKLFGPVFSGVHFTKHGQSKVDHIRSWCNDQFDTPDWLGFVEDKTDTLNEAARYRINMFNGLYRIEQPYNKNDDVHNDIEDVAGIDALTVKLVTMECG